MQIGGLTLLASHFLGISTTMYVYRTSMVCSTSSYLSMLDDFRPVDKNQRSKCVIREIIVCSLLMHVSGDTEGSF
jgi:hypothetical protein